MSEPKAEYNPLLGKEIQDDMAQLRKLVANLQTQKRERTLKKVLEQVRLHDEAESKIEPIQKALEKAFKILPQDKVVEIGEIEDGLKIVAKRSSDRLQLAATVTPDAVTFDHRKFGSRLLPPQLETISFKDKVPNQIFVFNTGDGTQSFNWGDAQAIVVLDPNEYIFPEKIVGKKKMVSDIPTEAPLTQKLLDWVKEQSLNEEENVG